MPQIMPATVKQLCECKKESALICVRWSGAGINLNTRRPKGEQLRSAVHTVLETKSYREQARRL